LSRSSALASKATGYPIAKIAAKIGIGYTMAELKNSVTGKTSACFEPALDYVVVKIPRWPFDKFSDADRTLGTQMKATGEVMGLGRNLETALLKAVRSLETKSFGILNPENEDLTDIELETKCAKASDNMLYQIAEGFRRGWSIEKISGVNQWNPYFLKKIKKIVDLTEEIKKHPWDEKVLKKAKKVGFADKNIAYLWNTDEEKVYAFRQEKNLLPVFKMVDTCAGEFDAMTPYFYSSFDQEDEGDVTARRKVVVLGFRADQNRAGD
jgi:carbamoyl-phosphate synthase large subunit